MPKEIKIFAIEVKDPYTIRTTLTDELSFQLPTIMQKLTEEIKKII
jgi:hypothetical protein